MHHKPKHSKHDTAIDEHGRRHARRIAGCSRCCSSRS